MKYRAEIIFSTDKQLTAEQIDNLLGNLELQVSEPVDTEQEAEDYTTFLVSMNITEEGK
jgi:hypothetical protein